MSTRTNNYPGTCINCGRTVDAGKGVLSSANGRWVTAHTNCAAVTTADGTLAAGWSDKARNRGPARGDRYATTCRYCGGIVRRGGCVTCGEPHEDY